jgi:hypothetical protein
MSNNEIGSAPFAKGLWGCYGSERGPGRHLQDRRKRSQDQKNRPGRQAGRLEELEHMKKGKNDTSRSCESPSRLIDARIKELGDWRGETLSRIRSLIRQADPGVIEEWKWRGVPVWSHDGLICTGETYKNVVKLTFAKGAQLRDPSKLFNSSLEGKVRRAIDLHEGDRVDDSAFKALIRDAVALNTSARRG